MASPGTDSSVYNVESTESHKRPPQINAKQNVIGGGKQTKSLANIPAKNNKSRDSETEQLQQ